MMCQIPMSSLAVVIPVRRNCSASSVFQSRQVAFPDGLKLALGSAGTQGIATLGKLKERNDTLTKRIEGIHMRDGGRT